MRRAVFILVLLIASCNPPGSQTQAASPTAIAPTQPTPETTTVAVPRPFLPEREKYTLDTIIDYDRHSVIVDETILYPNRSGHSLDKLVLAVAPNLWRNCFSLKSLLIDNILITDYSLNAHRMDVSLPASHSLLPDSVAMITLSYRLALPFLDQAHSLRARIFGYSDIQMNLVNWYPYIVPFMNGEWSIREPWSHGEYLVYPFADFEVNLTLADPHNAPVIATSGYAEPNGGATRYILTGSRAFAISASRDFEVSSMQAGDATINSYYLPIFRQAGLAVMDASAEAVQVFSELFGRYPHKSLSIVMADFKDSMEFSALYFHSRSFYDLYAGKPDDYLSIVAVHETAHEWWFDQVANDQALEPWLDESLATYSESLFYEIVHPDLLPLWWSKRIDFFNPNGFINIPVYEGQNADRYKQIVYFNGAHFLKDLRARVGDGAFFDFLRDYYAQNQGKVANANDFFRILDEHTDVDYSDIVRGYFKNR